MGATVQQFKDMPVPVLEMAAISEIMPQGLAITSLSGWARACR